LTAFAQAYIGPDDPAVRRSVGWLMNKQNPDGGWGESNDSYAQSPDEREGFPSTAYQSAWGLLGLLAAGEARSDAARRGAEFLMRTQQADGLWSDPSFTAPGFPRVFYLRYHGYSAYFPLWALAAYRTLTRRGTPH
jgi:squalene-hopene/tetraprenyl-beta-curcumene cyclase